MSATHSLAGLGTGRTATVTSLRVTGDMRRRLLDLGLVEGTVVECVGNSPAGDPKAYLIRGAVIALRASDADGVLVEARAGG